MAKRKDSLALFEVFGQKPTPASNPAGGASDAQSPVQQSPAPATEPVQAQVNKSVAAAASVAPPLPDRPAPDRVAQTDQAQSIWQKLQAGQGKTLDLKLSQMHVILAGVGLLVVLGLAFMAGRMTAGGMKSESPVGPITGGNAPEGSGSTDTTAGTGETTKVGNRIVGKYYLVIQGIPGKTPEHYQDAQEIVDFLKENDVRASIHELSQSYIVWSEEPMDRPDDKKALDYVRKIEDLGDKYKEKAKGKYNFSQKGGRDGKPWYIPQPKPQKPK